MKKPLSLLILFLFCTTMLLAQKDFTHGAGSTVTEKQSNSTPTKSFGSRKDKESKQVTKTQNAVSANNSANDNDNTQSATKQAEADVRRVAREEVARANNQQKSEMREVAKEEAERANENQQNQMRQVAKEEATKANRSNEEEMRRIAREEAEKTIKLQKENGNNYRQGSGSSIDFDKSDVSATHVGYDSFHRFSLSYTTLTAFVHSYKNDIKDYGLSFDWLWGNPFNHNAPLFIEYGVGFSWVVSEFSDEREDLVTVSVPVMFGARIPLSSDHRFSLEFSGGITGKFHVVGMYSVDWEVVADYFNSDDMGDYVFNRFQCAYTANAGINLGGVYLGYRYCRDFTDMQSECDLRTYSHFATIGFNF